MAVDNSNGQATELSKGGKLQLLYGSGFPGLEVFTTQNPGPELGKRWRTWVQNRIRDQEPVMRARRLHSARHRHFRAGRQWISSRDGRTWREPQRDKNTVRATINILGPALDYRLGVLREQRPGFRWQPVNDRTESKEEAEAQQQVVEYYFHTQRVWLMAMDASAAAQTDGAAFLHVYIDREAGPEEEMVELVAPQDERYVALVAQGYRVREDQLLELPVDADDRPLPPGSATIKRHKGDLRFRVVYSHEVIADPEAKTINGPYDAARWLIIRRPRDVESARIETNDPELQPDSEVAEELDAEGATPDVVTQMWERGLPAYPGSRLQPRNVVYEYIIYLGKSPALPNGAWLKLIGDKIVAKGRSLVAGVIPLARFTDGSSDPDLFPRPVMSDWIGDQVAINMLASMILQHARIWGPGRMLSQKQTQLSENWTNIMGSVVEYEGMKPDVLQAPNTLRDAWAMLEWLVKKLEDKTGWNDLARGSVSGSGSFQDVSGRALLGARELFERNLGPMVRAAADGMTEWAELVVQYAQFLFDEPRLIPIVGGRTDLARRIDAKKLGKKPLVYCDPETLMPMPRALRNQMLFDLYQQGVISLQEYKSRAPFALIQDVYSGEQAQWSRAQRINEILTQSWQRYDEMANQNPLLPYLPESGVPVLWADEPMVHQAALLELILDDRKPWGLRRLALERYVIYQELQLAQQGGSIDPATGMPILNPVPMEVVGAPPELPRKPAPSAVRPQQGGSGLAPATPATTAVAPEMSGAGLPAASMQQAQPLGEFGDVERQFAASGSNLPQ